VATNEGGDNIRLLSYHGDLDTINLCVVLPVPIILSA
jgi:hypothetical protein